jgi:IS1 family transposase
VDRQTRKIISFRLGDRSSGTLTRRAAELAKPNKLLWQAEVQVDIYYCDHYAAYNDVLPKHRLKQEKAYTYTVESKNAQLRNYTKMLNRRTKAYAKTFTRRAAK